MKKLLLLAALVAWPVAAFAQFPAFPTISNGYGTLAVTAASTAVSTVTIGPSSNTWIMPLNGNLTIYNSPASAGNLYVCLFGGTCTSSNGFPLIAGQQITFNIGGRTTSPTVIADSTATALIGW